MPLDVPQNPFKVRQLIFLSPAMKARTKCVKKLCWHQWQNWLDARLRSLWSHAHWWHVLFQSISNQMLTKIPWWTFSQMPRQTFIARSRRWTAWQSNNIDNSSKNAASLSNQPVLTHLTKMDQLNATIAPLDACDACLMQCVFPLVCWDTGGDFRREELRIWSQ